MIFKSGILQIEVIQFGYWASHLGIEIINFVPLHFGIFHSSVAIATSNLSINPTPFLSHFVLALTPEWVQSVKNKFGSRR
jgi:hypothetical protein